MCGGREEMKGRTHCQKFRIPSAARHRSCAAQGCPWRWAENINSELWHRSKKTYTPSSDLSSIQEKKTKSSIPYLFPRAFYEPGTTQLSEKSCLTLISPCLSSHQMANCRKIFCSEIPSFLDLLSPSLVTIPVWSSYLHQDFLSCIWALLKRMCIGKDIGTSWEVPERIC